MHVTDMTQSREEDPCSDVTNNIMVCPSQGIVGLIVWLFIIYIITCFSIMCALDTQNTRATLWR